MFKKILAATDGSEEAAKAVALASDLAEKHDAKLILLHVVPPAKPSEEELRLEGEVQLEQNAGQRVEQIEATPHGPTALPASPRMKEEIQGLHQTIGEIEIAQAREIPEKHGVRVETLVEQGDPAERIIAVVERECPDAIVMGRSSQSYLEEFLHGSVSRMVAQEVDCTFITVQ